MKVLMINSVCGIPSTGRICTDLAEALDASGHEVKIAYGRGEVPKIFQKYAVRVGSNQDVLIHGLFARTFDGAGFGSKATTRKFIRWVKEYDPDVIYLHNLHGYYINVEILFGYLRTCGKKIIWTIHDCWAFTGHSAYCDALGCSKWITGCSHCPNIKTYPISYTDHSERNWKKKRNLMTGILDLTLVSPSNWMAKLLKASFLAQYPVEVIHNGIDTSLFHPLDNDFRDVFGIGNKFLLLGLPSAEDDVKGLSDYILLAELLDESYQVVLAGVTSRQRELLPSNIIAIEKTNSVKEQYYIQSSADLIINFSCCDNDLMANPEAITCNIPFLTYKKGVNIMSVIGDITKYRSVTTVQYHNIRSDGYWTYKQSLGLIGKKVLLGVSSGWESRKGLKDIIKLSKVTDAQIIIVGVTKKQQKNIPDNIKTYIRTNSIHELQQLYAMADYYINPTYEDNFPTTNIEALACGTPVTTYRTGGSVETADEATGLIIEKGAYTELDCNYFFDEKTCCERSKLFTKEVMLKAYLSLY